jgi:Zn-dependent alcohol dehydrogenase
MGTTRVAPLLYLVFEEHSQENVMKAAVCNEFGKPLVIEDIDIDPPAEGQVKVARFAEYSIVDQSQAVKRPLNFIKTERILTGCDMGATNMRVDIPKLVSLYQSGKLKLDELITNRYPLERINEAIESVERGEELRNVILFN